MVDLSYYAKLTVLKHLFNIELYTPKSLIYLALCTGDPGVSSSTGVISNEVTNSNNYSRTHIHYAGASGKVQPEGDIVFPTPTGSWGSITHWAIMESASYGVGEALAYGSFFSPFYPSSGSPVRIEAARFIISLDYNAGISSTLVNLILRLLFCAASLPVDTISIALTKTTMNGNDSYLTTKEVTGSTYEKLTLSNYTLSDNSIISTSPLAFSAIGADWDMPVSLVFTMPESTFTLILFYNNSIFSNDSFAVGDTIKLDTGNIIFTF